MKIPPVILRLVSFLKSHPGPLQHDLTRGPYQRCGPSQVPLSPLARRLWPAVQTELSHRLETVNTLQSFLLALRTSPKGVWAEDRALPKPAACTVPAEGHCRACVNGGNGKTLQHSVSSCLRHQGFRILIAVHFQKLHALEQRGAPTLQNTA